MAVVYHEIYLPIDTESTFDYIVIKQGDAGTHRVRATLISNNRVYTIPTSGASYFMKFRKPDNNYCLVEATVSDNTISAEVTEEMLRVSGTGRGEFMIVSGSDELKTATFHVKIVKETFTSGDVQSHSDFAPFAALLQGAGTAASNANTAAAAANAAASLAEQKAQAIPDDYSDLVAEVEEVKADLVNLEPGLSDAAKVALLECFRNVAWVDTNAYIHYGALEEALGIKKWDFEWNASSGVIPNGMTYGDGYTPEFSDDGLHILRADLPFYNYDDDCELEVCMKYDVEMSSANAMTPQLDMVKKTNGNLADGAKMWGLTDSGVNVIKENFSGQTVATNIEQDDFHVYNLKLENSTLTLSVDGSIVSSGQGISNNQYFPHTGIVSSGSPRAYTFFKSIKFRRIIKTQMSDSDELNINYGNLVTEYTTSIVSNAVNDQRAIAWYDRGISEILEYNGGSPRSFTVKRYPIPIPDNATKVTMEYVGNFLANLNLFVYNNANGTYTLGTSITTVTTRENGKTVVEINRQGNEVLFLVPLFIIGNPKVLPTNVRITFGFD